jgi:hypothetical protein
MIEFFAYLPPIQSAIMVDGTGDLMQAKLNIYLKISPDAIRLIGMTGKKLKVTVEELTEVDDETKKSTTEGITELDSRRINLRRDKLASGSV